MIKRIKGTKVLVTGAEGFIGSHLSRMLLKSGARVNAVVYPQAPLWRLGDIASQIKIWPVNLLDEKKIKEVLFKINPLKIYHLAARVAQDRSLDLFNAMLENNVKGTINLMKLAMNLDIDCFINTGTCEEYGVNKAPFREEERECPVSPYSASKVCTTYIATMFYKSFGLPVVTIRPFLTYGPAQDESMFVPSLILSCLENKDFKMSPGKQTREFNYIDDIARGFIIASITPGATGEVINLGNGKEYRIIDVARLIKRLTGAKIKLQAGTLPYRPGEAMHFYSSADKARRILKWRAETGLKKGLIKTIDWYRKHLR